MIREFVLPQLSMGMSEGSIIEWAVEEGGRVEKEAVLVSIETEKVVNELPSPCAGYVHLLVPAGETVPIETPIAKIADTETAYRQLVGPQETATRQLASSSANSDIIARPTLGQSLTSASRTRITAISGLAKKIARQQGIDVATLTGTGPGGRIVRRDVLAAAEARTAPSPARLADSAPAPVGARPAGRSREKARIPVIGMRKTIAERMLKSKTTAAAVYTFFEVDVTKLLAVRETLAAREKEIERRVSTTALYVKALASAIRYVPICNATLVDDEVILWESVNVAIAVALPGKGEFDSGLVVPVVHDVESKGLLAIDQEIKDLVTRARAGKLTPPDTSEGTVTLSSSAGFYPGGWMIATPLLNLPMVVSFSPGTPIEKPVIFGGQVAVGTILPCGLTFDHRAMDGEPAGRLARSIADHLANPELMLL